MLKSLNHLIQKAETQQPENLMKLLAESRGFEGVEKFDSHHVQPLLSKEYLNCWSLPLVTLTSITMSLPNIQKDMIDYLLSGVSEAKCMVTELESTDIEARNDDSKWWSISANSMYRITETILLSYHEASQKELFVQLSSMIAGILSACLTNLHQVIAMKCYRTAIEKMEASVQAAAQLLGETTQIINSLQQRELPCLDPNELAFIDKWRAYFRDYFP
ncbi:hypothetical protein L2E82_51293 [Cichorium intybus]|nr:hypothetical protein L2E82_51293 [Cichorium intybus]